MQMSMLTVVINVSFMPTILIFITLPQTSAVRCYTCGYNKGDTDTLCLTDPMALNKITDCDKKYCTIVRQESVKPREVTSFVRGCEDVPVFLDKVVTDWTFKTYFRSCTKELCNTSDGVSNRDPNVGSANNTVIAGKNKGTTLIKIAAVPLAFLQFMMLIF